MGEHPEDQSRPLTHTAAFETNRGAMFGVAYRVLGTVQDSEDAIQETWLRWQDVDLAGIREPRAYLLTAVTRAALNTVRSHGRRREEYPGPWLPEPVSTGDGSDPARAAELADDVSLALLVVMQSLSPLERAAFVLRDVFGTSYADVAETLDRSEPSVRQLVRRARAHVRDNAPRHPVDTATHAAVTEAFHSAAFGTGDLEDMIAVLSPDVVLTTDAGGHAKAAFRPIRGVDKVLRFVAAILVKPEVVALSWGEREVNGRPALVGYEGPRIDCVIWLEIDDALVTRIDMVRNPDKLGAVRL